MFHERDRLETPEHVGVDFEIAGPMSRMAAGVVDMLLVAAGLVVVLAVAAGVGVVAFAAGGGPAADLATAFLLLGAALVYWLYFPVCETWMEGQTPGKRLLGIRVARVDGLPLDLRSVVIRNIGRLIDMQPGISYVVGIVAMTLHPRALRVGDILAGTWVVRERQGADRYGTLGRLRAEGAPGAARLASPAGAASSAGGAATPGRLLPAEYELACRYEARRSALDPATRRRVAGEVAAPIVARLGESPPADADRFLRDEIARGIAPGRA
jgi:uncharacterized RDD family membrane protein YckC